MSAGSSARGCKHPVRLRGVSREVDAGTGEVLREFASDGQPDGVILTPCGNRRAHVCGPCSEVYRGDAWQLVVSALRGGKGVPESVATHPLVFATFTAPSFGPVHTVRESNGTRLRCRPRSRGEVCSHGRSLACSRWHADDDPCLGDAICPECFDYERLALWNNNARRLFKRTRTYVERELARQAGLTQKDARAGARLLREGRRVPAPRRRALPYAVAARWCRRRARPAAGVLRRAAARQRDRRGAAQGQRPGRGLRCRPLRLGSTARRPRSRPGHRSRRSCARGRIHREVRNQVHRGRGRCPVPDREGARAAQPALP